MSEITPSKHDHGFDSRFDDADIKCITTRQLVAMMNKEREIRIANSNEAGSKKLGDKDVFFGSRGTSDNHEDLGRHEKEDARHEKWKADRIKQGLSIELPEEYLGYDIDTYKNKLSQKPKSIFGSNNVKIEKSKTDNFFTVSLGIPAMQAILYNDSTDKFFVLDTCPSAGSCKDQCWARKGQYRMNDGVNMALSQRLNYMVNKPDMFIKHAVLELNYLYFLESLQSGNKGKTEPPQMRIRWNDVGDFFSEGYFNITKEITNELIDKGVDVRSYAYTKVFEYSKKVSDNYLINYSIESSYQATPEELDERKLSIVVPKKVFADLKKEVSGSVRDYKILIKTDKLKERISEEYDVPVERLRFMEELPDEEGEPHSFDVIVVGGGTTGDPDTAAQREDVRVSYLLFH